VLLKGKIKGKDYDDDDDDDDDEVIIAARDSRSPVCLNH
jgi:hypothetical protein